MTYDLGILGGMGTQATAAFFELLTAHTAASCDAEHLNTVILNRADTPDRTRFILGKSPADPLPFLLDGVKTLNAIGVRASAIPCNTSHYFYERLAAASDAPILNMVDLALSYSERCEHPNTVCVLATLGTVQSDIYRLFDHPNLNVMYPDEDTCKEVHSVIEAVKDTAHANIAALSGQLAAVMRRLNMTGSKTYLLACTELSVLDKRCFEGFSVVDAMDVLALSAIAVSGKRIKMGSMNYDESIIRDIVKRYQ